MSLAGCLAGWLTALILVESRSSRSARFTLANYVVGHEIEYVALTG